MSFGSFTSFALSRWIGPFFGCSAASLRLASPGFPLLFLRSALACLRLRSAVTASRKTASEQQQQQQKPPLHLPDTGKRSGDPAGASTEAKRKGCRRRSYSVIPIHDIPLFPLTSSQVTGKDWQFRSLLPCPKFTPFPRRTAVTFIP